MSEEWVFPMQSPVGEGYSVHQPATFTVDFDDNTGTLDESSAGGGSSGESDDGKENDSPVRYFRQPILIERAHYDLFGEVWGDFHLLPKCWICELC